MARNAWPDSAVRFRLTPKVIRPKELPALDDEFARDLGDYQTLDELKEAGQEDHFPRKAARRPAGRPKKR